MPTTPLHILLVEDNPGDAHLIVELVAESFKLSCVINQVARVSEAIDFLAKQTVDIVLLDLNLPDAQGMATMNLMEFAAQSTPVIVLTGHDDPVLSLEVIKAGAQDYLIKGKITVESLERSIRHTLERHRAHYRVRESEQFLIATLDALSSHIAILDPTGEIVTVNRAWREFAKANDSDPTALAEGMNYLTVCDASAASGDGLAAAIGDGIRAVIKGSMRSLHIEYPCHSPEQQRWFELRVTPFPGSEDRRVVVAHENITARKLAEQTLTKTENILEKVFATIPVGVWLLDAYGTLIRGNNEAVRIWGADPLVTSENYKIFKAWRLPDGNEVLPADWAVHRTLKTGEVVLDELLEIEAFNGVRRKIIHSTVPLLSQGDVIEGALVVNLDITKRRRAEDALTASEQRLRLVFDASPNCMIIKDSCGRHQLVNQKTAELFCTTPAEMIGKTDQEMSIVSFEINPIGGPEHQELDELHDLERLAGREEYLVINGRHKWFRVHRTPIAFGNIEGCTLINAIDITAARKLREKLRGAEVMTRSILDSLTSRVVLLDKKLRITWANHTACTHSGKTRAQMTGKYCYNAFLNDQTAPCKDCPALRSLASGQPSEQLIKSNQGRSLRISALPLRNAQQEITGVIEVADDITERLALGNQLRQAQKMESLGTLAGGIAHDFNNILSGILGFSELALMKADNHPEIKEYLKEIYYAGARATELVRQILTFSRKSATEPKPLQISLVVREAIRLLRSTLPTTVELRSTVSNTLPLVLADPTQIHQIIMNLCTNASHAMEPDGGVLTVTLGQIAITPERGITFLSLPAGEYVQLQVSDTGNGISEEHRPFIFDPYFTTKDLGEGTGLGLAVVHGIVKEYQGDIHVDSVEGKGSTFTILLPATEEETSKGEEALVPRHDTQVEGNVLLVDDEPAVLRTTRGMLTSVGYAVTIVSDPYEALDIFSQEPYAFDLVLSDVTMPKMTGDKLGQKMLAIRPDLPIILMTGFNQRFNTESIQTLGFCALIDKPFQKKTILELVKKIMETKRSSNAEPGKDS